MFKAFTVLALATVGSCQFLSRDLQGAVTLQQSLTTAPSNNVTVATAFTAACTATATGTTDSCPGQYCCASLRRAGTAVTTAAAACVPLWFNGTAFNVTNVANTWTCINAVNTRAYNNVTAAWTSCQTDDNCTVGSCCATWTDSFGPTASPASVSTRKQCVDGTQNGTATWSTYPTTVTTVATTALTVQGSCTNVAPASFGAYIKASAMMLVALISVALF